jgi:Spy/CpxP family protein refolding chaperone
MPTPRRNAVLLLVAVFVAGLVVGVGGLTVAERSGLHLVPPVQRGPGNYLEFLSRSLDLTPAQRDSVKSVLDRHRSTMDSMRAAVAPPFETLRRQIRSEIRAQLTPAQQQQFDAMGRRNDSTSNHRNDAH